MTTQSKAATKHDLILAARQGLLPARESARLGGLSNMLRKELGQWWGSRTWWVKILIWVLILNGVTTIIILNESGTPGEKLTEVVTTFLQMAIFTTGIGTVISAQGAIVGEKELGTAAWIISKPASRSAFILAKIFGYAIGFWITSIIIPAILFLILTRQLISAPLNLGLFMTGLSLVFLNQLFYLTLTLMLGTFFDSRSTIAGIGIVMIMTGVLLKSLIPLAVMIFTPYPLWDISGALAMGSPLPSVWWVPVTVVSVGIIVMTAVALWRFGREEF